MEVVGRFAPTPSGRLHLGNLLCALLAWLSARSQGGGILLRVEDLDRARLPAMEADTRQMLEDLRWLGLPFDGGEEPAAWQSRRTARYEEALAVLREKDLLYPCYCSRAELHAASAPHLGDSRIRYDGRCYRRFQESGRRWPEPGVRYAVRVRVPHETVSFTDRIRGEYGEDLAAGGGDFVVRRSDGVFAYQLAAADDDGATGVTEVYRGRDLLSSTPGQIWLCRTLGYQAPAYAHIPLLLAPDGRRLSKRDGDDDLSAFRARGARPEDVTGLLAYCAGLLPRPEPASPRELIPLFDPARIPREDVRLPQEYL